MASTTPNPNLLQLEQSAFDAGIDFYRKVLLRDLSDSAKLEIINLYIDQVDHEMGMDQWRQRASVRSLEKQIKDGS